MFQEVFCISTNPDLLRLAEDPTEQLQVALLKLDHQNVSFSCANNVEYLQYAYDKKSPWISRLLDSFGRIGSGQMNGNRFWTGQYRECVEAVAGTLEINKKVRYRKLRGQYCIAQLRIDGQNQDESEFMVGICVPAKCSAQDLLQMQLQTFTIEQIKCQSADYRKWTVGRIACVAFCLLPVLLTIIGSLVDFVQIGRNIRNQYKTLHKADCAQRRTNTLPSISSALPLGSVMPESFNCPRTSLFSNQLSRESIEAARLPSPQIPSLPIQAPFSDHNLTKPMLTPTSYNLPKLSLNLNLTSANQPTSSLQLNLVSSSQTESNLQTYLQQALSQSATTLHELSFMQNHFNESVSNQIVPSVSPAGHSFPDSGIDSNPLKYVESTFSADLNCETDLTSPTRQNSLSSGCMKSLPVHNSHVSSSLQTDHSEPDDLHLVCPENQTESPPYRQIVTGLLIQMITCFSLRRSIRFLCTAHQSRSHPCYAIRILYPLKFLSLIVIMLNHCYDVFVNVLSNPNEMRRDMNNLLFYPLLNASFAVDTFFAISGVLLSYTFFTRRKPSDRFCWTFTTLVRFYLSRFWRLIGVYGFVLIFYTVLSPHLGSGPFWQLYYSVGKCSSQWWINLLFINNLFGNLHNECMNWTWYVANDMQFFLISPLFLALLCW